MTSEQELYFEYGSGPTSLKLMPRVATTFGFRQAVHPTDLGSISMKRWFTSVPFGVGQVETGYVFDKPRNVTIALKTVAGSERKAMSELEDLNAAFLASNKGQLRWKYTEQDGPTVRDRYLDVRRTEFPTWSWPSSRVGLKGQPSGGMLMYVVQLQAEYPFWRDYAETATDTVDLSSLPGTPTINNPGHFPIGVRLELSSLTGTWTSVTVSNATGGDMQGQTTGDGGSVTWTDTAFANADYLDLKHTYPYLVQMTSGNALSATGSLTLWPGDNSITVNAVGGTAGTLTFKKRGAYA